jgi:hypothetical protein
MTITPRARLAHASFWTMAGAGVHLGAGMLASIAAARILGATPFGELAITRSTLYTFTIAAAPATSSASSSTSPGSSARSRPRSACCSPRRSPGTSARRI